MEHPEVNQSLSSSLPPDDATRDIVLTNADTQNDLRHLSLAGDTYTLLLTGEQTAGKYDLIDMYVAPGGGPPPHRHDFEEMFTIIEGEIEFTFRGAKHTAALGGTVNIPANAPHFFRNNSGSSARMMCMCTPATQAEYFLQVADLVETRTSPPMNHTDEELAAMRAKAKELAANHRTEML
jgi:quercetin dioxygenase-like cupin family protein